MSAALAVGDEVVITTGSNAGRLGYVRATRRSDSRPGHVVEVLDGYRFDVPAGQLATAGAGAHESAWAGARIPASMAELAASFGPTPRAILRHAQHRLRTAGGRSAAGRLAAIIAEAARSEAADALFFGPDPRTAEHRPGAADAWCDTAGCGNPIDACTCPLGAALQAALDVLNRGRAAASTTASREGAYDAADLEFFATVYGDVPWFVHVAGTDTPLLHTDDGPECDGTSPHTRESAFAAARAINTVTALLHAQLEDLEPFRPLAHATVFFFGMPKPAPIETEDRVTVSDPRCPHHGRTGIVGTVDPAFQPSRPYLVEFADTSFWLPAGSLASLPPLPRAVAPCR